MMYTYIFLFIISLISLLITSAIEIRWKIKNAKFYWVIGNATGILQMQILLQLNG